MSPTAVWPPYSELYSQAPPVRDNWVVLPFREQFVGNPCTARPDDDLFTWNLRRGGATPAPPESFLSMDDKIQFRPLQV